MAFLSQHESYGTVVLKYDRCSTDISAERIDTTLDEFVATKTSVPVFVAIFPGVEAGLQVTPQQENSNLVKMGSLIRGMARLP